MKTRSATKKPKYFRGIPKEKWIFKSFQALMLDFFQCMTDNKGKDQGTWPKGMEEHMKWENINPQVDPTEALQQSGTYSGYTLFLSLCKNSYLATRIGREILPSSCRAHISVRQSGFKDGGLGLFAAARFTENDIVTIYFAPITTKEIPKEKKYTVFKNGLYHTVPLSKDGIPSYYLGAHFINDATWECKETRIKYIKRSNNCYRDGFVIKAKKLITVGE
mgnify:FL=1